MNTAGTSTWCKRSPYDSACKWSKMELTVLVVWMAASYVQVATESNQRYVELRTGVGHIRGVRTTALEQDVDGYLGIPYAKAPVGERRFQRPEPYGNLPRTWNATRLPNACEQPVDTEFEQFPGVDMWNPNTPMSEDCLFLNVWTPAANREKKRAVMVWIYGGSFTSGSSALSVYDGRLMALRGDVVVVSMQYRVGALGFLYLGIPEAPGNMGLLDQEVALQWVYNYIDVFGGDKHRITVFGESAGAVSTSLHLLSPLSQKLIQGAVMQSSSALCPWGVVPKSTSKNESLKVTARAGCDPNADIQEILFCLRSKDPASLHGLVTPTVDDYFLTEMPKDTLTGDALKRKNILLGVNIDEGIYFLSYLFPDIFSDININKNLTREEYLEIIHGVSKTTSVSSAETVAFEYEQPYQFLNRKRYTVLSDRIHGDSQFICPVVDFAMLYAQKGFGVYLYQFSHRTSRNPWPAWMGVMHGYEIDHVFGAPLNDTLGYTSDEKGLSDKMVTYWSNFAKSSDPNVGQDGVRTAFAWPRYTLAERQYIQLQTGSLGVGSGLRDRKCAFWRDLVPILRQRDKEDQAVKAQTCGVASVVSPSIVFLFTAWLSLQCVIPAAAP